MNFWCLRDVSFTEYVFPYSQKNTEVMARTETGGPDDDWLVDEVVMGDRGSMSPWNGESLVTEEHGTTTASSPVVVSDEVLSNAQVETSASNVTETEKPVETELTMGRGCREKVMSVKLRDYVSYNAQYLKVPHHEFATATLKSESSQTITGNTPYPIDNYISDEYFSPDHKAFLAAITSYQEPRNNREAIQQKIWRDSMKKEIVSFEENKI